MGDDLEREVIIVRLISNALYEENLTRGQGSHALETLLESHVDKAFDKFTAWALRNAFEIPPDLEIVLVSPLNINSLRTKLMRNPSAMAARPGFR